MSGTMHIPLSRGLFATVDAGDYEWLNQWKWCAVNSKRKNAPNRFYAVRVENERMILMHRQIMAPGIEMVVDHLDGDGINNTRANMRVCTQQENSLNRNPDRIAWDAPARVETSKQKGVTWNKRQQKWVVQVNRRHVGVFAEEVSAIAAARASLREV